MALLEAPQVVGVDDGVRVGLAARLAMSMTTIGRTSSRALQLRRHAPVGDEVRGRVHVRPGVLVEGPLLLVEAVRVDARERPARRGVAGVDREAGRELVRQVDDLAAHPVLPALVRERLARQQRGRRRGSAPGQQRAARHRRLAVTNGLDRPRQAHARPPLAWSDLWPGPAEHVAQDQDRALATRELLHRGQERELHALPQRVPRRGVGHGRREPLEPLVGERLDGLGPARPALELVEAGVRRDPVQPGVHGGAALEPLERPPGAQQRLLHEVLGVVDRAEHPVAVDLQRVAVGLHELPERALVAGGRRGQEAALLGDGHLPG